MSATAPHAHLRFRDPLPGGALAVMRNALPAPYDRGMERMTVPLDTQREDGTIPVPSYDFSVYERHYGRPPASPRYLLTPRQDVTAPLTVAISFTRDDGVSPEEVTVPIPAGHPADGAVTIPIPGRAADLTDRLRLVSLTPRGPLGPLRTVTWDVTALLGNLAKLLWVIGAEHETVAAHLHDVTAQRNTDTAHGASLDLLGLDLGAPRFPPRPHTVDDATIALFHLDDVPPRDVNGLPIPGAEVDTVVDAAAPGIDGREGVNRGAHSGRTGRFAHAFEFGPGASISVADTPAFALPATAAFTVEAIVRPDQATTNGPVVAKRDTLNTPGSTGWALVIGTFRGIDRNLRFSLSDGSTQVDLYADRDLGDGSFHHIAGALDRTGTTTTAVLHLDGQEVARHVTTERLGALTSGAALVLGQGKEALADGTTTTVQYRGLLEEVRLSAVARDTFAPVTGEADEQYRRRLGIFHRWLLPTPDALQAAVNEVAGPIAGSEDRAPFVVREQTEPVVTGGRLLRVLPKTLPVSQSIADDGTLGTPEEAAVGTAARDEPDFDPAWLISHPDRHGLAFADGEDSRRMQLGVVRALDALVERLTPTAGTLHVLKAYEPDAGATGLHGVGRAVLLAFTPAPPLASGAAAVDPGRLGVLAHAAGFGWVHHTRDGHIYAAQARGDVFRITAGETEQGRDPDSDPGLPDVTEGDALPLGIEPDPTRLADAEIRWSVLRSGAGDAVFLPGEPGTLHALAAGDVSVRVEVAHRGHVGSGTRRIRIGLTDTALTAGQSISGGGRHGATEAATAGPPTPDFDPRMLHVRTDDLTQPPRAVDYGTAPENRNRMMQRVTGEALDRLLDVLASTTGRLTVLTSYVPEEAAEPPPDPAVPPDPDAALHAQGRALRLRHSTLTASALAARAFTAGFHHIRIDRAPTGGTETVRVAVAPGEQLRVTGPDEVTVDESVPFEVDPAAQPAAACFAADGSQLFLAEPGSHRITSFTLTKVEGQPHPDIALGDSRRVDPFPGALAFGGGRLFVAHEQLGRVAVLTPDNLEPATPPELLCPRPAALATDTDRLYAGCGDATLRSFALTTGRPAAPLSLPAAPRSLAVAADGPSLYIVLADGRWCRVERATLALREIVDTHDQHAHSVAVTADGEKLYVISPGEGVDGGGRVLVYRPPDEKPKATIGGFPADAVPVGLSLSGDGKLLYVATGDSPSAVGRVHLVDVATDVRLPQVFSPGRGGPALAASPSGASYPPCLVMAPRRSGTVLLADPAPLGADPPAPPRLAAELPLGTGLGEELVWSSTPNGPGTAEPTRPEAPVCTVAGVAPGRVLIRATYLPDEGLLPYQCEVGLKRELDVQPGVSVTKEQYDLILNVLNWFHPLGVECRTDRLRTLAGLDDEDAERPRLHTFPTYHVADPFSSPFIRLRKDGRDD
ncbi:LamG-like jellyroll fold domain-containing protein [Streptomyces sp. NPDC015346]|uniref:LamG-like jellyroll fold domain-containing protein n=1 Tax=Streptomyces sp. NPDC015346 TaxID=3364954 RepID=UPI0036FC0687